MCGGQGMPRTRCCQGIDKGEPLHDRCTLEAQIAQRLGLWRRVRLEDDGGQLDRIQSIGHSISSEMVIVGRWVHMSYRVDATRAAGEGG